MGTVLRPVYDNNTTLDSFRQDIPTTEEEDVLLELCFERDCCSF